MVYVALMIAVYTCTISMCGRTVHLLRSPSNGGSNQHLESECISEGTEKQTGLLALAQGKVGTVTKAMYQN